ncbi:sperm-associated antigen 5 [Corythoichthys intestinalis]|uniref:sperm-associated antigen 5 n=1 Tax=Corythoichthys intestinalis TaxID=161448 RepID=UPI0025A67495|nr:sperm-associated antigen 5 [Corythoichthys intestinalis]XP_057698482.1 sperm-associated antigen 5 [Corythoichthys intestinalis]
MSSQNSPSSCGRPPLRSLENEKQLLSPPLRRKSKSQLNKEDVCLGPCSPPPAQMTQTIEEAACGLSDVTFKSFICSSGEVIVSEEPSLCTEDSIILPEDQTATETFEEEDLDSSEICSMHAEHPYCFPEQPDSPLVDFPAKTDAMDVSIKCTSVVCDVTFKSFTCAGGEVEISDITKMADETVPLIEEQMASSHPEASFLAADVQQCGNHIERPYCHFETNLDVLGQEEVFVCTQEQTNDSQIQQNNEDLLLGSIQESKNDDDLADLTPASKTTSQNSVSLNVQHELIDGTPVLGEMLNETVHQPGEQTATGQSHQEFIVPNDVLPDAEQHEELSEAKDSALGSSENGPDAPVETVPNVFKVLSEYPSVVSALHLISPIRRASMSLMRARRETINDCEKNVIPPETEEQTAWLVDHLESPNQSPLLNSTTLCNKPQSEDPQTDLTKKLQGSAPSFTPDGPLQQQLRQMAEFLILASGKMDFIAHPTTTEQAPVPVESRSTCVGVTPVKRFDRSLNTSGEFVRKAEFSVADACTLTDPLLWNCFPNSLERVPREELEQRLLSSMIVVEALVQQLAAARAPIGSPSAGPPPSELRDRPVQTDHTELSQTTMYRDLYMEALNRIGDLEQDGRSLQELVQSMQGMCVTMTSLRSDTDAALADMKKMEAFVREDHKSLALHYDKMKLMYRKFNEIQLRMTQKVKEAFQQRDEMKTQMEDALTSKDAAFSTMEQLRTHCAHEMAELQRSVGSQRQLLAVLNGAFTEQVALNKTSSETLDSTLNLVSQTVEDQSNLTKELSTVRNLVQRSAPLLAKLNEKAAAALRERDEHVLMRDQVVEEKMLLEEKLKQAQQNLQAAEEQIGDLNQQVTILTSESAVLRQKLMERENERTQLESTMTQMSATLSSTKASHTMLEHMLAEETSKLQEAQRDASEAKELAEQLASSKLQAEEDADELGRRLAEREEDFGRLLARYQSQSLEIQQLRDVCTELGDVADMNAFLQTENQVAREQLAENENILMVLHERNIQCEDLKEELHKQEGVMLHTQEQLQATQAVAVAKKLEWDQAFDHAVTEITLIHFTLRKMTNELHHTLVRQKPDEENTQKVIHRDPSSSLVDNVMVPLTAQNQCEEVERSTLLVSVESPSDAIFSKNSAFTRLPVKKSLEAQELCDKEEEQNRLLEPLSLLSTTITELVDVLESVQRHKDAQLEELQRTVSSLETTLQAENSQHKAEVSELNRQLSLVQHQAARQEQARQQQEQSQKIIAELMANVTEAQEMSTKHSLECHELRRETSELRRSLQRSQAEVQILHGELMKAAGQTAGDIIEEKLVLVKEVERMKKKLQETEQTKAKLLERAKRHQMIQQMNMEKCENELQMLSNMVSKVRQTLLSVPEVVNNCEKLKMLSDYLG